MQGPPSPQWNNQPSPTHSTHGTMQVDQQMPAMTLPRRHGVDVYGQWE